MPKINVTGIILRADFCEAIVVTRRAESINEYGESGIDSTDTTIFGVVTAGSQQDFDRGADGQSQPNRIMVHTPFRLVGPAVGYQPDMITWRGRQFIVMKTYDYSHYGPGFVAADCASIEYLDSV